jgi:hypothetical protein
MAMHQIGLAMLEQQELEETPRLSGDRFRELAEAEDASGGITSVGGLAMKAIPRHDLIPLLQIEQLPDGVEVAIVSCQDHDAFTALPGGLEVLGRIYGKSGWNSDRNVAYYRTDRVLGTSLLPKERS